jgi:hypothetical protein
MANKRWLKNVGPQIIAEPGQFRYTNGRLLRPEGLEQQHLMRCIWGISMTVDDDT